MTLDEFNDWMLERGLPDEWRISIDGQPPHAKVLTLADARLAVGDDRRLFLLHLSQEQDSPAPWRELTKPKPPPPPPPPLPTPLPVPESAALAAALQAGVIHGKIERKSEMVGLGCLLQSASLAVGVIGFFLCSNVFTVIAGIPMLLLALALWIYGRGHAIRPCCSICKMTVDGKARICPGCRCVFIRSS